jgi:RHS repeat-associated protein
MSRLLLRAAALQAVAALALVFGFARPAQAQYVEYIHTDALGTPTTVTDQARHVVEHHEYEPFGKLLNEPVTDGPGFTGHVADAATGLDYMQQRYYDPGIGRFLSLDPVTVDGNTGSNFNRYWYGHNNPYKFTDPDGRQDLPAALKAMLGWNPEETDSGRRGAQTAVVEEVDHETGGLLRDGSSEPMNAHDLAAHYDNVSAGLTAFAAATVEIPVVPEVAEVASEGFSVAAEYQEHSWDRVASVASGGAFMVAKKASAGTRFFGAIETASAAHDSLEVGNVVSDDLEATDQSPPDDPTVNQPFD